MIYGSACKQRSVETSAWCRNVLSRETDVVLRSEMTIEYPNRIRG